MGFRVLRGSTWRLWGAELCNSGFLEHPRILVVFSPPPFPTTEIGGLRQRRLSSSLFYNLLGGTEEVRHWAARSRCLGRREDLPGHRSWHADTASSPGVRLGLAPPQHDPGPVTIWCCSLWTCQPRQGEIK